MSGKPNINRKALRRQETIAEITAAAWNLSRVHGLTGFSMRDLGNEVGMRAQSLYSYFDSKSAIYDQMFLEGNRALRIALDTKRDDTAAGGDLVDLVVDQAERFVRFCTSDPVRYQLLFQRTIPDFEPSAESYAVAREVYDDVVAPLRRQGVDDAGLDLFTAVVSGLAAQQIANDPRGERWVALTRRVVTMALHELVPDLPTNLQTRSTS